MKKIIYVFCLVFIIFGCSKESASDGDSNSDLGDVGIEGTEGGVDLYFPQKNTLCNLGTDITDTHSSVYFEWEDNNSDIYLITIENLFTSEIITAETTEDVISITIPRATAFKWFVKSVKGSKTEQSETWQFYNAGPGEQSYVPFPAVIIAPEMAENINSANSVSLQWTGSDIDDDIIGYDVYFGTNDDPPLNTADVTSNTLSVSVTSGSIYYWKVITKDAVGNTSDSGIYQFKVL